MHQLLEGPAKLPAMVGRVVVVRRNEDANPSGLGRVHEPLDVFDRVVLLDTVPNQLPSDSLLAQEIVLRVGNHHPRHALVNVHMPLL